MRRGVVQYRWVLRIEILLSLCGTGGKSLWHHRWLFQTANNDSCFNPWTTTLDSNQEQPPSDYFCNWRLTYQINANTANYWILRSYRSRDVLLHTEFSALTEVEMYLYTLNSPLLPKSRCTCTHWILRSYRSRDVLTEFSALTEVEIYLYTLNSPLLPKSRCTCTHWILRF